MTSRSRTATACATPSRGVRCSRCAATRRGAGASGRRAVGCREQSGALPRRYGSRRNLVVGPLAMIGGGLHERGDGPPVRRQQVPAARARRPPGDRVDRGARPRDGRAELRRPRGRRPEPAAHDHLHRLLAAALGQPRRRARHVLVGLRPASAPLCVPLDVYVDGAASPRRAQIALGAALRAAAAYARLRRSRGGRQAAGRRPAARPGRRRPVSLRRPRAPGEPARARARSLGPRLRRQGRRAAAGRRPRDAVDRPRRARLGVAGLRAAASRESPGACTTRSASRPARPISRRSATTARSAR